MKYVAIWLIAVAAILLGAILLWLGYLLYRQVLTNPDLLWVPVVLAAAVLIGILVAGVEWITDRPKGPQGPQP